jgi:putative spermidine/putrescine transport system substrate-binding protein
MTRKNGTSRTFLVLLTFAAILMLAACGTPATPTPEIPEATEAPPAVTEVPEEAVTDVVEPVATEEVAETASEIIIADGGGAIRDAMRIAYYDPFEAETGIKVINVDVDPARVRAMVDSGNVEWDIFTSDPSYVLLYSEEGLLEPIDYTKFAQEDLDALIPEAKMDYGVGAYFYAWVMAYNTEAFPAENAPESWADFWDSENFSGPRSLHSGVGGPQAPLEIALLADGVNLEDLYPLDVDRAFESLEKVKPHVVKWWALGAEGAQALADQEAVIGDIYNARATNLIKEGAPLEIVWNQGIMAMDGWMIVKSAPHLDAAQQFIAFASSAERQAEFAKQLPYGPVNTRAAEFLDEETLANLPTSPEHLPNMVVFDTEWWMENYDAVTERFQEFLLAP